MREDYEVYFDSFFVNLKDCDSSPDKEEWSHPVIISHRVEIWNLGWYSLGSRCLKRKRYDTCEEVSEG
jgi:hypothetical protein